MTLPEILSATSCPSANQQSIRKQHQQFHVFTTPVTDFAKRFRETKVLKT